MLWEGTHGLSIVRMQGNNGLIYLYQTKGLRERKSPAYLQQWFNQLSQYTQDIRQRDLSIISGSIPAYSGQWQLSNYSTY